MFRHVSSGFKELLSNGIVRDFFLQENFPNSAFEPYLLDQGLLNSKLVGDFQTFDWISQWLELHRVSSGFIVFHQHFIMFHPPESQQQTIQPAVLLQDHLFVLVLIEAALGRNGKFDTNLDVQLSSFIKCHDVFFTVLPFLMLHPRRLTWNLKI